ncbi:MAG TPA: LemA family protein [Gammaproteobacteria bacterium]|jgi:LemA protein|nr:LemA family protein [Gammaproteobacteria bacterium]
MRPTFFYRAFGVLMALVIVAGLSGCGINTLPRLDEQVKASWSQVLNQYKRRADLVPNLVATVKGYAQHERDVLISVTQARAQVGSLKIPDNITENPAAFKKFQNAQANLTGALSRLLVVAERYPQLKANQNFLTLQAQLEGTENRISVARRDYIQAVQKYNTELRTIPGRWYASLFYPDAEVKQNFTISKEEMQTPKVQF